MITNGSCRSKGKFMTARKTAMVLATALLAGSLFATGAQARGGGGFGGGGGFHGGGLAAVASIVALSLEDFTVLARVPSFEDLMATTTGTTTTATGRMATGTTTLTIIHTTTPTTTAVATFFGDGCTPRMAGVCNLAKYAVDRPSLIDVDRGLKRKLTA